MHRPLPPRAPRFVVAKWLHAPLSQPTRPCRSRRGLRPGPPRRAHCAPRSLWAPKYPRSATRRSPMCRGCEWCRRRRRTRAPTGSRRCMSGFGTLSGTARASAGAKCGRKRRTKERRGYSTAAYVDSSLGAPKSTAACCRSAPSTLTRLTLSWCIRRCARLTRRRNRSTLPSSPKDRLKTFRSAQTTCRTIIRPCAASRSTSSRTHTRATRCAWILPRSRSSSSVQRSAKMGA